MIHLIVLMLYNSTYFFNKFTIKQLLVPILKLYAIKQAVSKTHYIEKDCVRTVFHKV